MNSNNSFLYSVRDVVAENYSAPFVSNNDGVARRNYADFISKLPPNVSSDDFELWCLGTFCSDDGIITVNSPHVVSAAKVDSHG